VCVSTLYDVLTTTKSPNDTFLRTYPRRFATYDCIVIVLEREQESIVFENGNDISSAEIQLSLTAVAYVGDVTCFGCAQSTHFAE